MYEKKERIMAWSGWGVYIFKIRIIYGGGGGGSNFYMKILLGGFSFETQHFFCGP